MTGTGKATAGPEATFFEATCDADEPELGLAFCGREVTWVAEGGWAEAVGVQAGDEIEAVGGVENSEDDEELLHALKFQRPLVVKFRRARFRATYYELECAGPLPSLGIKYVRTEITGLEPDGWAAASGVRPGDEIVQVNGSLFHQLSAEEGLAELLSPRRGLTSPSSSSFGRNYGNFSNQKTFRLRLRRPLPAPAFFRLS